MTTAPSPAARAAPPAPRPAPAVAMGEVPRVVLGLYDGTFGDYRFSHVHQMIEMPLNHLGLVVRPHDIRQPLPAIERMGDVRGIVTAFISDAIFADPAAYLAWLDGAMRAGKRVAIMNFTGVGRSRAGQEVPLESVNRVLGQMGVRIAREEVSLTYSARIALADPEFMNFEAPVPRVLPPFERVGTVGADVRPILVVSDGKGPDAHLIVTSPRGGYAARRYAYVNEIDGSKRQWYLDPFAFFRAVFATDELPKPDTTTLSGRRIYYSHVDGDGWRNKTLVERWAKQRPTLSIDVLRKEAIEPFPDLPVTVAPIAADLDPDWYGDDGLGESARALFALPQVEAGSHTYSHPFDWGFFSDYTAEKEAPFLKLYPPPKSQRRSALTAWLAGARDAKSANWSAGEAAGAGETAAADEKAAKVLAKGHRIPRAYAVEAYDFEREVRGSVNYIAKFLPAGKKVELYQWSGNTSPDERTIAATRAQGVANINGGDSRFDPEFPSHGWVAPLGRAVGREWQVYATNSNENTYTGLWSQRFFGFRHVEATFRNTERPARLKPMNVYYHVYAADLDGSLDALLRTLKIARASDIAPIAASRFARIADGFYRARIEALGPERWRILDRGALQTIRFDRASAKAVDFARSEGVVGTRHHQGSLYVALDESHLAPVIALRPNARADEAPDAARPYLVQSRWRVWGLRGVGDFFEFEAQGFGPGEASWRVPLAGRYRIETVADGAVVDSVEAIVGSENILDFRLGARAGEAVTVRVRRLG